MVERTRLLGLAAVHRQRAENGTQQHSLDDVGRHLVRGGAQGRPPERTMHETGANMLAGRAIARHELALDDMHPIVPALITGTLPVAVMMSPPNCLRAVARWYVCFRISPVQNAFASIVRSLSADPLTGTRRRSCSASTSRQ